MDINHIFGNNTRILQSEVDIQTKYIIDYLKKRKQTYSINKFVLEEAIKRLNNQIID